MTRALLAGYELSGITRFQTGALLTPTGNTSIGGRRADYSAAKLNLPNGERTVQRYFNTECLSHFSKHTPRHLRHRHYPGAGLAALGHLRAEADLLQRV
ncbi:MAG: hypothetical protein WKF84_11790 [Pyrinomonadaceae bacterium]